jgi:hypothetical protein
MIFKWKYQRKFDLLNTNLDAHYKPEIKCNNETIPFVNKFTLLGVILDEYLTFDLHTISICKKVNWKISVLKKSSYLFNINFRITLFKLFIISKYDYCSTLFFHFQDALNEQRLDKNFRKSLKSYLNIKLSNLNISEQYSHLKSFRLTPLRLRFFQNFVFFLFSLIKCRHKNVLTQSIESLKKNRSTRSYFNQPVFESDLYKFSFMSISIRLLNSFIYSKIFFPVISLSKKKYFKKKKFEKICIPCRKKRFFDFLLPFFKVYLENLCLPRIYVRPNSFFHF